MGIAIAPIAINAATTTPPMIVICGEQPGWQLGSHPVFDFLLSGSHEVYIVSPFMAFHFSGIDSPQRSTTQPKYDFWILLYTLIYVIVRIVKIFVVLVTHCYLNYKRYLIATKSVIREFFKEPSSLFPGNSPLTSKCICDRSLL